MNPDSKPTIQEQASSQPAGLEESARRLAAEPVRAQVGVGVSLLRRLGEMEILLERAQRHFSGLSDQKSEVPSGAEWLLDNFYLVQQVIRQVRQDLPEGFYRQLPVLANPEGSS